MQAGVVKADEVYSKSAFFQAAGIGRHTWQELRRAGFPIRFVGKRAYVRGEDWLRWVTEQPPLSAGPVAKA